MKKARHDNLDDEQKEHLKTDGIKRKNAKCDNHNVDEKKKKKRLLRKYEKGRKLCMVTLMMNKKSI